MSLNDGVAAEPNRQLADITAQSGIGSGGEILLDGTPSATGVGQGGDLDEEEELTMIRCGSRMRIRSH